MKLKIRKLQTAAMLTLAMTMGMALAQHPLQGTYVEQLIGMVVEFQLTPTGELTGTLHGAGAPLPINLQADQQTASGWFMLENEMTGFSAQLQPDGSTLQIWFYGLDMNNQVIPGTEEQYTALRQHVDLSGAMQPPAIGGPPMVGQAPGVQPPMNQPPMNQPPMNQPPMNQPPAGLAPAAPQGQGADLVGTWQGVVLLQDLTFYVSVQFNADGTYREEGSIDGIPTSWYTGVWEITPEGLLKQTTLQMSPEFCVRGQCSPNVNSGPTLSMVEFQEADLIVLTLTDVGSSQPMQPFALRRAAGAGWGPNGPATQYGMPVTQWQTAPTYPTYGNQPISPNYGGSAWEPMPSTYDPFADTSGTSDFISAGIWGDWDYTNPESGDTWTLPYAPDPDWNYTTPAGDPLTYEDGTWYEDGTALDSW